MPDPTRPALPHSPDAPARPGPPRTRKERIGHMLGGVWAEIQAQHEEMERLHARLAEATDAADQAHERLHAAEAAVAERDADIRERERAHAENAAILNAQQAEIQRLQEALRGTDAARPARPGSPAPHAAQPAVPSVIARPPTAPRAAASVAPRPLAPPPAAVEPPQPPPDLPTVEALYRAFCRDAGGLNSQPDIFAASLVTAFPAAVVRTVFRDADSPARPIVLTPERRGNSAVPFWAVSVDGRHLLVPQPMGADQFRELAPCFTGQAAPATLAEIIPATLTTLGSGFELCDAGRVA